MPPTPNAIDLTTLAAVKSWVASGAGTSDDQTIQDCITAFSAYVLRLTGRGPSDGSVPATSPFVQVVSYNEWYDGPGGTRLMIRNWPIVTVVSVTVDTVAIPQSTAPNVPGWVIDGTAKSISMRGNGNAGFVNGSLVVGFQNLRSFARGFVFSDSQPQNVNVQYTAGFSATPLDLEMAARKTVALNYKRRQWIGQKSQAMAAGAGTVSYGTWEYDDDVRCTLRYYERTASGL